MFEYQRLSILVVIATFGSLSSAIEFKILPTELSDGVVNQDFAYEIEAVHEHRDALYNKLYLEPGKIFPEYNFHVSIERGEESICSGAIVNGGRHVVTAASCDVKDTDIVRINSSKQKSYYADPIGITCVKIHPNFGRTAHKFDYNIAVLRLNRTTTQTTLYPNSPGYTPNRGKVTHYSALAKLNLKNTLIVTSDVPIMSPEDCRLKFGFHLTENMLCAGVNSSKVSFCFEDLGSPLFYRDTLIGVKSWGEQCSRIILPEVYTDVSKVQEWILNTTKSLSC